MIEDTQGTVGTPGQQKNSVNSAVLPRHMTKEQIKKREKTKRGRASRQLNRQLNRNK